MTKLGRATEYGSFERGCKDIILQMTSLRKINVAAEPKRSSHIL